MLTAKAANSLNVYVGGFKTDVGMGGADDSGIEVFDTELAEPN